LHNEEFHNLNTPPNIVRMIKSRVVRWMGHVARVREMRNACIILVRKPEGKRQLERSGYRLEDNNKINIKKHRLVGGVNYLYNFILSPSLRTNTIHYCYSLQ
jgi:hypothetical protein